jgi:hypothetical protein
MPLLSKLRSVLGARDKRCTVPTAADDPWYSEERGELRYMRRSLVVLRPNEPYVRWVRGIEPHRPYPLAEARRDDAIAFLIPMHNGEAADSGEFISRYWRHFFAQALEQVTPQRALWPPSRSEAMLRQWFDIELCQPAIDLGGDAE